MKLALVLASALMLVACARKLPPPVTAADVSWAQQRWPSTNQAELEHGRKLLLSKCGGSCHRPPLPADQPPEAWPGHVGEMAERSGLTAQTREVLERYLITLARPMTSPTASATR